MAPQQPGRQEHYPRNYPGMSERDETTYECVGVRDGEQLAVGTWAEGGIYRWQVVVMEQWVA